MTRFLEESPPKAKIRDKTAMALFSSAVLVSAVLSMAALSSQAYAAQNAYRYPPYSPGYSNPNNTCVDTLYADYCASRNDSTGLARVFSDSANNSWVIATVEHNVNPPQSNPSITVTTPNFVEVKFKNTAHGKFYLSSNGGAQAILKVGLWTTVFRQADQTWIKDQFYAQEYSAASLPNGEYTIPWTVYQKTLWKNNNPGKYGVGTHFSAWTYGSHTPIVSFGKIDAWNSPRELQSSPLAVECSACP